MTDPREALKRLRGDVMPGPFELVGGWVHALLRAILAAGRIPRVEGEQPGCTGAGDCPATAHTHGCHADTQGHCEHPEEHGWTPPGERAKPTVEDVAQAIREQIEVDEALLPVRASAIFWPDVRAAAKRVLARCPGRTEAEVKAEALREAAEQLEAHGRFDVPVWTLLRDRAARIEDGGDRG